MIKSRPCFSGWKIRHHKMRTAASNLCCSLPCHHLLFSTSHISLIILFRLKPPSFYSIVKTSQEIRLLRHPQEAAFVQCNSPARATSANLSLLVVTFHSIQTRCQGPPKFTNNSRAEPCGSQSTRALTLPHMDNWHLCLREKKGPSLRSTY